MVGGVPDGSIAAEVGGAVALDRDLFGSFACQCVKAGHYQWAYHGNDQAKGQPVALGE